MDDWRDRVVVVTGASAGIGRATAVEFAARGASVALLARSANGLDAARREVEAAGGRGLAIPLDVADEAAVEAASERIEEALGAIDVWVNDAMVSVFSPAREMTAEEYRRVTEVTYLGYVHGTLAALRRMLPRDRGVDVQVGSALAYRAIPLQSAYCAAKHAINGFTEALRTELLHDRSGVRVTMVELPAHNTPQFDWVRTRLDRRAQPVPPIYAPEVAARAIVRAARGDRREWFVGWPTIRAVVGDRLFPGLLDRYLAEFGYRAQQTDEPEVAGRPDNLWQPVEGLHRTHGRFTERERGDAIVVSGEGLRAAILGALGAALLTGVLGFLGLRAASRR